MTLIKGKIIKRKKRKKPKTPQGEGEISISGHMAGLNSDDNVLDSARKAGLPFKKGQTLTRKRSKK